MKEVVVVLSADDLTPGGLAQKMLLGLTLDFDFIMVNQIMYTFHRSTGYLVNNGSQEIWTWKKESFYSSL